MLHNFWYQIGRLIVSFYIRCIMRVDIQQDAPFPKGAKIIAVNHPSTNDPAFVTALSAEHMTILIKDTVFKVPLFGHSLRFSGHVPVIRGQGQAAMEEGIRLLREGRTVMIFPEGEISPQGSFHKPHTGVARMALLTGVPVVPVGISVDGRKVNRIFSKIDGEMEPISWYLRGPYAMTVGKAVNFHGSLEDRDQVRDVTGQIMHHIVTLSRRGDQRLSQARAPRYSTASPRSTLHVAWSGTRLGFQHSARLISQTAVYRLAESAVVFVLMFARQFTGVI